MGKVMENVFLLPRVVWWTQNE